MESNKTIDLCTKISIGLLLVGGLLSLFELGPAINPLYQYIPAKVHILFVCSILGTSSSILVVYLIYQLLNNKMKYIYKTGFLLLIMTLISNLFLGANIIFIVTSVITLIMLAINIVLEETSVKVSKDKLNKINSKKSTLSRSRNLKVNQIKLKLPKLSLPKLSLPKVKLPKIELFKISQLKKIKLPKIELPKINFSKINVLNVLNKKLNTKQSYRRYNSRTRSPRRYHN